MKLKKFIAAILSAAVIISSLAFGMINSYAETTVITDSMFNIDLFTKTNGYDDKIWYVYTPSQSGVYTLYGLKDNVYATECYLFEKTEDANGKKYYEQIDYSYSNPNYENYENAAKRQFCLQHYLVAGVSYYYAAGWNNPDQANRTLYVRFINESYDSAEVVSITPSCDAELTWYTDGSWEYDDAGNAYYLYNISKIISNMTVTLEFDDGTVLTSDKGAAKVGGYPITYTHNQSEAHWYNSSNENYTANTLTVTVLGKSVDYEVVINESALLSVSGKVADDFDGSAVENAGIYIHGNLVATTKSDGTFSFVYSPGTYTATVKGENIVERDFTLTVDAVNVSNNNHTGTPVSVVTIDYVGDNAIDGRDYAYIKKNLTSTELENAKSEFIKRVGFTKADYDSLTL